MCNKLNKNSIEKTSLNQNPTYIFMLPAAPSGPKARRGKRLISRQKKLQRTIPPRNSLQQLPKNRRLRRKTIRGICMQRPFQLVQKETLKHQMKFGK